MNKLALALTAGAGLALASCQATGVQGTTSVSLGQAAAVVSERVLSDTAIEKIVSICDRYGGVLKYAALPMLPDIVRETAEDAAAYCEQIVPAPKIGSTPAPKTAVVLPLTTDSNTANWMERVVNGLKRASEIARVALPGI